MSKKRYINTKFWSDDFVINLKPLERYFFLYLLTNEHTDICGIYELSIGVIKRETDLTEKQIIDILRVLESKIVYIDNWVCIKNFEKHQAVNPKVIEGIKRSKELVPDNILAKLSNNDIDYDSLSKTTIETELPTLSPTPTLKPKPSLNNLQSKDCGNEINQLMEIFSKFNPATNYGNKTQRKALEWLIGLEGFENAKAMVEYAISIQGKEYTPTITTPVQFKNKFGDLRAYAEKQKQKSNSNKGITILK